MNQLSSANFSTAASGSWLSHWTIAAKRISTEANNTLRRFSQLISYFQQGEAIV
jgi:hypothetical protein